MKKTRLKRIATPLFWVSLSIAVATPAFGQTVLVSVGSTWKYLDDGSDQGSLWKETGFDDDGWDAGPAQLGYGDGDETTIVGYGPDPNDKYITTYFRHTFNVSNPSQFAFLHLKLLRDDGAVVFLNGVEFKRSNMPDSMIDYRTPSFSAVGGDDENTFYEDIISAGYLNAGTNVLAVEIHQWDGTSSDISFDLELLGLPEIQNPIRKAPYLIFTGDNREMRVLWQLVCPDTCRIEWGLNTSYSLGAADTYEYGSDHQHRYTIQNLTPSKEYFYRVIAEADTFSGSFWSAPHSRVGKVRFFAYGDTRTYPADHDQVATAILAAHIAHPSPHSLLISMGDLITHGDIETEWDDEFFVSSYPNIRAMLANIPYQSCMGNHEGTGVLFKKYFPYPFEADRYWSFDYGPVHFTVVDQYVPYGLGSAQYDWIVDDLTSTTKPWKFIYFHEPGWSAGGHPNNATVQSDVQPLCELYGVSIVFAGHNHYYARAEVNGIQHVTTGGGGAPLNTPNLSYPNIVTGASAHHYCDIEIDGGTLSYVAVSVTGDTLDAFTLEGAVTAVELDGPGPSPRELVLYDARPNPFNPWTVISFDIPNAWFVELNIYNVKGQKIRTLVNKELAADRYEYKWDGNDDAGRRMSSGLYFYRLRAGVYTHSKKMLLLK